MKTIACRVVFHFYFMVVENLIDDNNHYLRQFGFIVPLLQETLLL